MEVLRGEEPPKSLFVMMNGVSVEAAKAFLLHSIEALQRCSLRGWKSGPEMSEFFEKGLLLSDGQIPKAHFAFGSLEDDLQKSINHTLILRRILKPKWVHLNEAAEEWP
ncbi:Uncharacterized protein Adt_00251 [Abeliophyllum distichum]|uniref:Uncharacterized protein n=1 Tax=Abeliophyllum distichum TaxID=126358 RepID=A0ABD1VRB6_9LAMI